MTGRSEHQQNLEAQGASSAALLTSQHKHLEADCWVLPCRAAESSRARVFCQHPACPSVPAQGCWGWSSADQSLLCQLTPFGPHQQTPSLEEESALSCAGSWEHHSCGLLCWQHSLLVSAKSSLQCS